MTRTLIAVYLIAAVALAWAAVRFPDFRWLYALTAVLSDKRLPRQPRPRIPRGRGVPV